MGLNKQFAVALAFFSQGVIAGQKNAIAKMNNGGFDGISYNSVFGVKIDTGFASVSNPLLEYTKAGRAKMMSKNATDFPTLEIGTKTGILQESGLVGLGVVSNFHEAEQVRKVNGNDYVKKVTDIYEEIEKVHDAVAWGTDTSAIGAGVLGFFNHPFVAHSEFSAGKTTSKTKWSDKNSDEIIEDVVTAISDFYALRPELNNNVFVLELHVSSSILNVLRLKKVEKITLLQYLEEFFVNNRYSCVIKGTNAVSDHLVVGDFRKDSLLYEIPLTTEAMETRTIGMTLRVDFIAESKGLQIEKRNTAIIYKVG